MRKLLNTVYVTNENAYLTLDGENLVCSIDGEVRLRIPFENIENIVYVYLLDVRPALMGKCAGKTIPINFISPQGKFLAKICGETKGMFFSAWRKLIRSGRTLYCLRRIQWQQNSAIQGS